VEDRVPELAHVILSPQEKSRLILKIEEIVFKAQYNPVSEQIQDACEIVHYHVLKDLPVRLSLVKLLLPDIDFKKNESIGENQYDE